MLPRLSTAERYAAQRQWGECPTPGGDRPIHKRPGSGGGYKHDARASAVRQLHDGAALRISALSLQLGLFRHRVPEAEPDLHASIEGLQDELHAVLQELRDVAGKIYP